MKRVARFRPALFPFLACAVPAACSQQDATSGAGSLTTTFDTAGGTVHVTNTGTPPEWRLVPVVSIGPTTLTDESAPEEFGGVNAVALGPERNVFVADALNREVRVFGLDGAHVRTFGRDGEGPGEFRSIYSIAWVGDRLLTYDPHLGRIGEFSAGGEWLGQRTTAGGWTGSPADLRFYPVGPDEVFRNALGADMESAWVGHHSRGDTGDTIPWFRGSEDAPGAVEPIFCEAEGCHWLLRGPVRGKVRPAPGVRRSDVLGVGIPLPDHRHGSVGDTLRVIERTLPAEPVSDAEWAVGNEEYDEFRERYPNASCRPRTFSRPDRKPFIDKIYVAPDGKLWVEVIRTAGNRWEFFDPEGRLLGSVPAAPYKDRSVPVFAGDYLAAIRQDELELDHVDVWRLVRIEQ